MKLFLTIAALFSLPVLLKAFALLAFSCACEVAILPPSLRILLPAALFPLGYAIFLLEGVQSSVILGNRMSDDTFKGALETLKISESAATRAKRYLGPSLDHAPIDQFIVGRQLLIIGAAFLFKFAYDGASLTPLEATVLHQALAACAAAASVTIALHSVLDHWLFATLLCSVLVAYVCQVTAKLMAQNHPMRFMTNTPLAIFTLKPSRWVGQFSMLVWPLSHLRKRGERRNERGRFSYFASRESSPIDTKQLFGSLVTFFGESITEVVVTVHPWEDNGVPMWLIRVRTTYEVVSASRTFAHAIYVPDNRFVSRVVARIDQGKYTLQSSDRTVSNVREVNELHRPKVYEVNVEARFPSDVPEGSAVEWYISYLMSSTTRHDERSSLGWRVFELPINKPVRRVRFGVEDGFGDPIAEVLPIDGGLRKPKSGKIERTLDAGMRWTTVDFPSINSRLQFLF